ncbi:unnamed protein product [Cuscuta europaea]|uniref:Uncharacterized protein n=1 Tax=Cuscuta europaea TaxID=41803 RepID=A0A9P1DZL6_CUSEU|nr:unnamed protein product [Cuscuta europaea]
MENCSCKINNELYLNTNDALNLCNRQQIIGTDGEALEIDAFGLCENHGRCKRIRLTESSRRYSTHSSRFTSKKERCLPTNWPEVYCEICGSSHYNCTLTKYRI